MGAAAIPVAAVASIAAVGFAADSKIQASEGTNAADQAQADRLDRAAQYGKLQASEAGAQLTERIATTLGNIDVVRAAAHDDPSSPTGFAVRDRTEYLAERNKNITMENIYAKTAQDESDAAYMRQAGAFALQQGDTQAMATIFSGIGKAAGGGFGGGLGGGLDGGGVNPDSLAGRSAYSASIFG